jgi:type II restriction enzyme
LIRDSTTASQRANPQKIPDSVELGVPITEHDKLPDVVLFDLTRNWFFLVEAVTSHGPVSPQRIVELEAMLSKYDAGPVCVSAFPDMTGFKKHAKDTAWETEVWLADVPDHLIHFNGDRFFGSPFGLA